MLTIRHGSITPTIATRGWFLALIAVRALRPGTRFRAVFRASDGVGAPVQALGLEHIYHKSIEKTSLSLA